MPGSFITFIVLAIIAGLSLLVAIPLSLSGRSADLDTRAGRERRAAGSVALTISAALLFLAAIPLAFASTEIVSTRNIGVVTVFGKPTGKDLSNGFHWKNPMAKVHEMEGSIQILNRTGEGATTVRLGNNSLAKVDNSIQWRIKPEAAPSLYMDYKGFEGVTDNLVTRQANAALNDVLGAYNPLISLEAQDNENRNVEIGNLVAEELRKRVGDRIEIKQVIIPVIRFDDATQAKIDQFNAEVAATRVAEQRQQTAKADAEANRIISESVKNDPNVIVSRCVDSAIKAKISPAGCWPGTSVFTGTK